MLRRATTNPKTYIALDAADERIVAERSSAVKNVYGGDRGSVEDNRTYRTYSFLCCDIFFW